MKNNGVKNSTLRVAVCSIVAALSTVLMLMTTLIPIGTYAFPCFAGMIIAVIVVEYGLKWSLGVYASVAILSLILAGDKEAAVFFIVLFGYYPILKNIFERRIKSKLMRICLKLIVFNAAAVSAFFITTFLLSIPAEEYSIMGFYVPWVFLIIGNIFFVIYDYAISLFAIQYVQRLRGKIFRKF